MKNTIFKKGLAVGIIFLLVGVCITSSTGNKGKDTPLKINISKTVNNIEKSNYLKIKNIRGGIGITFLLTNEGDNTLNNITINIEAIGRFIKIKSPKIIHIPELKAGQSTKQKLKIFGLGFGEPVGYKRIKIMISAPGITTMERIVLVNIVGPFVNIISVFFNDEAAFQGYTLFAPEYHTKTYLINNNGDIVNKWSSNYLQCADCYLLENGNLLRSCLPCINHKFPAGGITGRIEMFNWGGDLIWEFEYSYNEFCLHHGFKVMPNGNILMIAWERKEYNEAIANGRNPLSIPAGVIWPCYIIEVEPIFPIGGKIVWEWHVWDHLIQDYDSTKDNYGVVADHPELIDLNFGLLTGFLDWNHINSVDYNEELDQILISLHVQNEIWIIDHNTTIEEAAGHTGGKSGKGGDILYRWGNPQAYRAGTVYDQKLFGQHDARWIKKGCPGEGHITIFNNGFLRLGPLYSSVEEIIPPVDENGFYYLEPDHTYGPKEPIWSYTAENPTDFYASIISGAQRLPNGNTLICDGTSGVFFEVTHEKEIIWKYVNLYPEPVKTNVVKIHRYPLDYSGIKEYFIKNDYNNNLDNILNFSFFE
ncbi:hypothetical protein AYK24_04550 [Thermoplasmatales archaeon SG8-52-4]|nr:MAG: hypothetical protein AYK24_04550 [Thermoplasmatales archaeon SG8-52-4]